MSGNAFDRYQKLAHTHLPMQLSVSDIERVAKAGVTMSFADTPFEQCVPVLAPSMAAPAIDGKMKSLR